ncbi:transglutaminase-like cysteine peptidase [Niveibacterium sp. SC-1]|uniref:transglutaminase-like cysteine peptidase n=1 Tax=Niveibacterium sp. SC-1 TaxID=3135646 RepID=UPI00311F0F57
MHAVFVLAALCCALLAWAANDAQMIEGAAQRYGAGGAAAVREWRALVAGLPGRAEAQQLRSVNDFFNRRIRFADDQEIWNQADYWATPIETLGRGAGDCEDFALAKYFSLREAGVDAAKLRLIYVRARIGGPESSITQAHMVLGYYATPDGEPEVLDNLIGEIRPASRRPDLTPVFSFNSEGVYASGSVSSIERLTRWKGLLLRMRSEGYAPQ